MTDFDLELSSSAVQQFANASKSVNKPGGPSGKSSKKNKKKKNKIASSLANGSSPNPASKAHQGNGVAKLNEMLPHTAANANIGEPKCAEDKKLLVDKASKTNLDNKETADVNVVSDDNGLEIDSKKISGGEIEHGKKEKEDFCIANETMSNVADDNLVEFPHFEKEVDDKTESWESSVVVKDESGCIIPAMDFLTDRLLELMRQPENQNILTVPT